MKDLLHCIGSLCQCSVVSLSHFSVSDCCSLCLYSEYACWHSCQLTVVESLLLLPEIFVLFVAVCKMTWVKRGQSGFNSWIYPYIFLPNPCRNGTESSFPVARIWCREDCSNLSKTDSFVEMHSSGALCIWFFYGAVNNFSIADLSCIVLVFPVTGKKNSFIDGDTE